MVAYPHLWPYQDLEAMDHMARLHFNPLQPVDGNGSNRMLHHINLLHTHPTDHTLNSIRRNILLRAILLHQGGPSLLHTVYLPHILMYHRLQLINNTPTQLYCLHPIQQQYACLQTRLACL